MISKLFVALILAVPAFAQQPVWAQCGGNGWSGSTTCVSGTTCVIVNEWYYQCQPGSNPPAPTTPVPTTTAIPTTPPPVSTTPPGPEPTPGACPAVPGSITLRANAKLPDPFTNIAGQRITTKAGWQCRRQEIFELIQRYESGVLPPKPSGLTATYSGGRLSITASEAGKSITFTATISANTGSGPLPALIGIGGASIPRPAGVAAIAFDNNDIAEQTNTGSRGRGKFYTLYGSGHSASALTAWAWGVGRVIDALEITTGHNIDTKKLAVTGCSRNGKGALTVGAFEPRIALTIPQESGSGGAGCWRISDAMKKAGIDTQTASQIITENVWFSKNFEPYVNRIPDLPFDHHLLSALIAPRALLIIEQGAIDWLGHRSNLGCQRTAKKVWDALGVPDNMGVSMSPGHDHCSFPSSQNADVNAFFDKFFKGLNSNTNFVKYDNEHGYVESQWVDWTTPTLT
ncbi:4-O-methyl-glucuronoyl methylesterase [Hypsizygus marmoreus]|uniref:(4-O-methyl)-D-glucuronate--lignin esterase n=1 Tax=Hypsizygus marmoreus TaxID=39966 RepID=A0A369JYG8_HYPMA|nr:4-O-methyl-glucuronoyl methylesterase [Hypsizygus marmoreus]